MCVGTRYRYDVCTCITHIHMHACLGSGVIVNIPNVLAYYVLYSVHLRVCNTCVQSPVVCVARLAVSTKAFIAHFVGFFGMYCRKDSLPLNPIMDSSHETSTRVVGFF